jgi:capsular polysaccharide biosynthesis protein
MTMTWDHAKRSQLNAFNYREGAEALKLVAVARAMAEGREPLDLRSLLAPYVQGVCSFHDHLQYEIRKIVNEIGVRSGFLAPGDTLFEESLGVKRSVVASLCPELAGTLYTARSNAELEEIPLLEPCPNELADNSVPPPMNMLLHRSSRPAVRAYATHDAVLYAHPFRYQLLSKDRTALWISGSPRSLSRAAIGDPAVINLTRDIIVLQDRFNGTNFSHFLFDSMSRVLLLEQQIGTIRSSILVFGGVPGEFHHAVCNALSDALNLDTVNIYFPDGAVILETSQRCIWFSDQVEAYLFPAQMAHPASINLLRSLVETIPGEPGGCRRVYISRADAEQRRVVNDEQISVALKARGFATVELSKFSIARQIGLFRDAEIIVAPHGMGLTHLAVADRLRGLVELFPPSTGSDAYACIAKAGRIDYNCIVGASVGSPVADFEVNLEQISRCLDRIDRSDCRPAWRKPANLLPGSKSFSGFRAENDGVDSQISTPELIWGNRVFGHSTGGEPSLYGPVVGRWSGIPVIPGLRYTASCWLWIPSGFAGMDVSLGLGECSVDQIVAADLTRREAWQRISITGVAWSGHCNVELRLSAPAATALGSTCWQLERGSAPTSYVETP